jgi:hypothetical protein
MELVGGLAGKGALRVPFLDAVMGVLLIQPEI